MFSEAGVQRKQGGNTLVGLLVGLLVGVAIAAGVALFINFGPKPFVKKDEVQPVQPMPDPISAQSGPIALPGKPGDQPVVKPKFDFYKTLPGGEAASAPAAEAPATAVERIYLQAGAYQNPSDADNLKARLALMGIEAGVQRVDLAAKGIFYRVRLGTFATSDAADSMRARLAAEGIETSVVRSKP